MDRTSPTDATSLDTTCAMPQTTCGIGPQLVVCSEETNGAMFDEMRLTDASTCGDASASTCTAKCAPGTYTAVCGGATQGSSPPSASCLVSAALPSGTVFCCCPCE